MPAVACSAMIRKPCSVFADAENIASLPIFDNCPCCVEEYSAVFCAQHFMLRWALMRSSLWKKMARLSMADDDDGNLLPFNEDSKNIPVSKRIAAEMNVMP